MQLTHHTDYSLRVLIFLSLQKKEELATINDIAKDFNMAKNHLTKVVHKLAKCGYVKTVRGKNGGLCLAKPAEKMNIGEIVKAMETTKEIVNCQKPVCPLNNYCDLKDILDKAQANFFATLAQYTLADVSKQPGKITNLLNLKS